MPAAGNARELAAYLVSCSQISLGNFYLARLDRASHLERNLQEIARELIETLAFAELADLLRQHGEAFIVTSSRMIAPAQPRSAAHNSLEQENADLRRRLAAFESGSKKARPTHICASNYYALQDNDVLPCQYRTVGWAIARSIGTDDEWSSAISHADIGKRCGLSAVHTGRIVRDMCDCRVLEVEGPREYTKAEKVHKGGDGQASRYRFLPQDRWLAEAPDALPGSPRPQQVKKREEFRFDISKTGCRVWGSNYEREFSSPMMFEAKTIAGELIGKVFPGDGSAELKFQKVGSRVEMAPAPINRDTGTPITDDRGQAKPSLAEASIPLSPMIGVAPAIPAPAPKAVVPTIHPDTGPSGVWEKTKEQLKLKEFLGKEEFEKWIAPTREAGVVKTGHESCLIIVVPSLDHQRWLTRHAEQVIRRALAAATGTSKWQVQGVVEGKVEIVPPGAMTVGAYADKVGSRARGGFNASGQANRRPSGALPGQPGKYSGLG